MHRYSSKTRHSLKVGYAASPAPTVKPKSPPDIHAAPACTLKGTLEEAGFEAGRGVTVKISEGCIVLMAECNEVQELREQLYQAKQTVKGMQKGMFSMLNEAK
ncbi:TPA: SymE family type I addiction module toxin [Citrobacter koseri]|nr:SymE family type I addiction module toxin [Citrobacter koseri]HEI8489746.1 SymE family type I addiction module toxin [Citrobacter koseri]HEM6875060.1 SymE family type I addiction module toxin [Citrobacter koseri]HEM8585224.1 SymE family type I addiction module toxin [Citrobacter koseri]